MSCNLFPKVFLGTKKQLLRKVSESGVTTYTPTFRMGNRMREKTIEQKLKTAVEDVGGMALKLTCPGFDGMPDRMLLMPGGMIAFVEVKAPGKVPRPLQIRRKTQLEQLGFRVYCLDDVNMIGGILDEIHPA